MILPTTFDLAELLDLLKPRLSCFNIHARQLTGPLYTLDLAKCYDFLTEIRKVHDSGKFELREFIDNKLLKASDWLKCVTEPCSITESLVSLLFEALGNSIIFLIICIWLLTRISEGAPSKMEQHA